MKKRNNSNDSLFTSALFRIHLPSSREQHNIMGVTLVAKFGCILGATAGFILSAVYTYFRL